MKNSLCGKKLKSMMLTASFAALLGYLLLLTDDIIVGTLIGEDAVGGINLVSPMYNFTLFVSTLISGGIISCIIYEMGRFELDRINMYFTLGLIFSVGAGVLLFLLNLGIKDVFFDHFGDSAAVDYAREYYRFFPLISLLYPVFFYMQQIVFSDGKEILYFASFIAQIFGNVLLSIILFNTIGISGISLGSAIGTLFSIIILSFHFFDKSNHVSFCFDFDFKSLRLVGVNGIVAASTLLFNAVFNYILNSFFTRTVGSGGLPALAVAENTIELMAIFSGIGLAASPMFAMYEGEKNFVRLRSVVSYSTRISNILSISVTLFVILFSRLIVLAFGLTNEALIGQAQIAVILISLSFAAGSYLQLIFAYHTSAGNIKYGFYIALMRYLILPCVLYFPLTAIFGTTGMWVGMMLAPILAIPATVIPIWKKYGKRASPFLFGLGESDVFFSDFELSEENIISIQHEADAFLASRNVCKSTRTYVSLLIEEIYMLVMEKNPGKTLLAECTVKIYNSVLLVLKDGGIIFNVTDTDMDISNLRSFALASIMERQPRRVNLTTLYCNRNSFKLPINK